MHSKESHGIEFRLLGTVEVTSGDRIIEIGSLKQRALLASLVLRLNQVVSVDVLVEDLWSGSPPASVKGTLQSLVSRLRRTLAVAGSGPGGAARLRGRDGGYVLEAPPDWVDAFRFERLVAQARHELSGGDAAAAAERLETALGLWRGPALGDVCDQPFGRLEAERLEEARLRAVEDLHETLLVLGRPDDALARLKVYVAEHPLRERAWGQLMLAFYRLGRQADALRAYQQVRRILGEELGIEPNPDLRLLEQQILQQSSDLAGISAPETTVARRRSADIVVLLFTDIEASTRRWEAHQDAMANDLARHDALLVDAAETHDGEVFSHTGDGFCIAFPSVRVAVEAAIEVQRGLLEMPWASPTPIRVRMAIHAGPAERRAGNWFGPTLNRAARLLNTAAGGQVVCSQVAAELGENTLPAGVELVDLGEHRLVDLTRPERVYQITAPELRRDFPPLRSLDPHRHNLPVALSSFVGREAELAEVLSLLATARLVTLVGTGGAGKTRLALQAAVAVLESFPDGVWFVELAPLRDPDLVTSEVITSLGLLPSSTGQPGHSAEERLCEHLQGRRLLLILDNCEHVVEAAARLTHTVLVRCPSVTVLATSREVLGVSGEVVWTVPPLSMPLDEAATVEELANSDAVALFCERARAVQSGFGLSAANAAAVARICRRLDGLPLGLELAAARIRVLGAHQVAERLDDRFELLTGGGRTAVPRQQTLLAAMDWGYSLLPAAEQAVLRRMSVFRGTCTLDAAEAIVGTVPPEAAGAAGAGVLDLLTRLVDKSMVSVFPEEPELRYGLLETVREYAGLKLKEAGEADLVRTRHRDFFLSLADEWAARTSYWDWGLWIRRVNADRDNFVSAMEWSSAKSDDEALLRLAAAHWPYWYWAEAVGWRQWLPEAIARCDTPSAARVESLIALAYLLMRSGEDEPRGEALLREAADMAADLADDQVVAQVDFYQANVFVSHGQLLLAESLLRDALARSKNPDFVGWCHWGLGWIALREDHFDEAATEFRTSLHFAETTDDDSMRAHVGCALALVAALRGDHDDARTIAEKGVHSAERTAGAPGVLMMALALAGQVAILIDDDSAAAALAVRILRLQREKGVTYWADDALAIASLILADRLPQEAAVLLTARPCLREALDDTGSQLPAMRARLRRCRAQLIEALGDNGWQQAERHAVAMPVHQALDRALTGLEALSRGEDPVAD